MNTPRITLLAALLQNCLSNNRRHSVTLTAIQGKLWQSSTISREYVDDLGADTVARQLVMHSDLFLRGTVYAE